MKCPFRLIDEVIDDRLDKIQVIKKGARIEQALIKDEIFNLRQIKELMYRELKSKGVKVLKDSKGKYRVEFELKQGAE